MEGSHIASAVVSMSVRAVFDGGQMLAYMVQWTRCGFDMTSILFAPSWTSGRHSGRGNARTVAPGWRDRGMWRTIANFLCGTLSQVQAHGEVSFPWVDTGIAQGRVLSPLLFNLLVNSLAAAIRRASPGVRLLPLSDFRFRCQLYADDLVILAESEYDLQVALTAATLGPAMEVFFWDGA